MCDQNMDWSGCKSAPLQADVRSHLSGSSAIQPLAASGESWHRLFIYLFIYLFIFMVRKFKKNFGVAPKEDPERPLDPRNNHF